MAGADKGPHYHTLLWGGQKIQKMTNKLGVLRLALVALQKFGDVGGVGMKFPGAFCTGLGAVAWVSKGRRFP